MAMIFDGAAERWYARELPALREEARHFHVGIYAVFELAIQFQEKFVPEEHR